MKICYIGDSTIHVEKWIKWFAKKGHNISLITDQEGINGIKTYYISNDNGKLFNFLKKIIQTRKLLDKIKPDILHAHYAFGYGTFAAFSKFHPFVLSPHGSDILIEPEQSKIKKFLIKYALKKADLITCDGENTIEKMIKLGTNPKKIYHINHGLDIEKFSHDKKDEKIKKEIQIDNNSPVIISTRNLSPLYDIETTIKSIPFVIKKFPNANFIIVGEELDKNYVNHLRNQIKKLQISNNIKFIGKVSNDKIPFYLTSSDIYVSTSISDGGIAMSTLEAMSCEIPPIVTDVANNKKWIKDGENGFIIPIKNYKLLSEKIIYLIENKKVRMEFGKKSRQIVVKNQDYNNEMKKMEKLYLNLSS